MIENYNLKSTNEDCNNLGITINDANEDDCVNLMEVYRKGDLILYECENEDIGPTISNDIISEIFPDFEIDPMKCYLIEKEGDIYYQ